MLQNKRTQQIKKKKQTPKDKGKQTTNSCLYLLDNEISLKLLQRKTNKDLTTKLNKIT
jgi:hypothetical protein